MFTPTYLSELAGRLNLVELVRSYVPDLKQAGGDYSACCPFHSEKSPSFTVSPKKGFYHCFGCGAHGDAIGFYMEINQASFVDSVKALSSEVGMEIPRDDQPERDQEEKAAAVRFMRSCAATKAAQEIYALKLEQHSEAMGYLIARGVTQETIDLFGIGFAPEAWGTISKNKSINEEGAEWAGLTARKEGGSHRYDRFRNRIMFPIYGSKDYIIGFGGRAITDQKPKYLNSPEGEFFKKGDNLYGLKQAQLSKDSASRLFVVEGYMDVAMVAQYGVRNVVATLGTAVTEAQIKKLLRASARITFCLDGDKAGKAAAQRVAELVLPHLNELQIIDLMLLPDNLDPDEFMRERGVDAFIEEASRAIPAADFLVHCLKETEDTSQSGGMVRYLSAVGTLADQIKSSPMRLAFKKCAADAANISLDALLGIDAKQKEPVPLPQTQSSTQSGALSISIAARMLAISFIRDTSLVTQIEIDWLEPFLTLQDKEMLFPLMVYLKANPDTSKTEIVAALSYSPHIQVIKEVVAASLSLSDAFDAMKEARAIIDSFRRMQRIWDVTGNSKLVSLAGGQNG